MLHFAFLTRDRVASMGADAFLRANLAITHRVLSAARHAERRVGLVYASSGAVYDPAGGFATDVIDNPYGAAKRLDELALRAACRDAGASCVIPRVFSVSGPYMTKPELYALGDLILQASPRRPPADSGHPPRVPLVHRGRRPLVGLHRRRARPANATWCSTRAATSSRSAISRSWCATYAGRPDMPIERTWDPAADADRYVADDAAFEQLARTSGVSRESLPDQVAATAADLLRERT